MATPTDAESDDTLETSGTATDSTITAQGKPAETVGRSATPQGKTKAPSTAREKHGIAQPHASQDNPDQQARPDKQSSTPEQVTPHNTPLVTPTEPSPTQATGEAGDTQLKTGASNSLLYMPDKLSNKSSNAKKGAHGRVPKKDTTNPRSNNKGTCRAMEATRKGRSTRPRPSLEAGAQTRTQHIMDSGRSHNHQLVQPLMRPSQGRATTILLHLWIMSSYLSTLCRR
uniref:W protein n=1 Tax=Avian paramyxovirus 1 TaxID=2560319 RepID=F1CWB7_NCDV|nr:W protein [avian paramyxovirus 1]